MKRSNFIKILPALSGGSIITSFSSNYFSLLTNERSQESSQGDGDKLRSYFSLPDGYRYFNTSGIGAVPKKTRTSVMEFWNLSELAPGPSHDLKKWRETKVLASNTIGAGGDPEEIALTGSTTDGINIILNGLEFHPGDEIITSTHEHPALHAPLINIAQREGLKVLSFEPDLNHGAKNVDIIEHLITSRTKLVFVSLVTCTTGQWLPVAEISKLLKRNNVLFALDGAQVTGSKVLKIRDWGVDFYATGGQKWLLGPKRTGFVYIRKDLLDSVRPMFVGAYSEAGYDIQKQEITWAQDATRYEYATQNDALFHGLSKSISFLNDVGLDEVWEHNRKLAEIFYAGLKKISAAYILSPEEEEYRTGIITFGLNHINFKELAAKLSRNKFRLRVVHEAGLQGVRASFHIYNSEDEVLELLDYLTTL